MQHTPVGRRRLGFRCSLLVATVLAVWLARPARAQQATGIPQAPVTPLPQWHARTPNVVYILCDDLGYGDVHCLNPDRGKIPTPNMDRLASQGMNFTDAHASSALCTPSRYSIMTGRYNWRSRLQAGVLGGEAPPLLEPGRITVADLLHRQGYATTILGKWHLGLKFGPRKFRDPITNGPLQHGFDHFFGISASLDMPPFAWIEDDRFPQVPSVTKTWMRAGAAAPDFEAVDVLPTLATRAGAFVRKQASIADHKPFFLYLPLTSPHTPLEPTPQFKGKSSIGPYGDFVMETDWAVGEVLKAIDDAGVADDTIVFFASDNGFAPYVGPKQLEAKGHYPSGPFRGYKTDIWDGGHHEPFFVRWPGTVVAGSNYAETVCLGDLMATLAQVTGITLPPNAGEDSVSLLPVLVGAQKTPLRATEVQHSGDGYFGLRQGKWKLELCAGSGGWSAPVEKKAHAEHLPNVQLYDMSADVAEQHNVQADHPDLVKQMTALLEASVANGRTTPGPSQKNDVAIDIWKIPKSVPANTPPTEGHE